MKNLKNSLLKSLQIKTSQIKTSQIKNILPYVFFLLIWQTLSLLNVFPEYLIPSPWHLCLTFMESREDFGIAFEQTFLHTFEGFILSFFIGTGLAILAHSYTAINRIVLPLSLFFQTVPIIAIAPLLVIYLGFGAPTVIASSFIVSVFPMIANTMLGLTLVNPAFLDLFRLNKASKWQILFLAKLPSAYPQILSGARVSMGLAIIGTIAGEFVGGGGLGAMIDSGRTQQRVDIVYSCLILLSVMGILFLSLLNLLNWRITKWRPLLST